ncbi:MAG: ATP-dependent 6-phosphofructokinase [bacterium]
MVKQNTKKKKMLKGFNNVAILTSGGDAPGMNPCIRSAVRVGIYHGFAMFGIYNGYQGLVNGDFDNLTTRNVGGILHLGGTILGTSRFQDFKKPEVQAEALEKLKAFKIDGLIVIGGEGSLRGALDLANQGFPVIGVPATIDNDINLTDYAIGFDTSVNTVLEAIYKLRDTAKAHRRLIVLETMGRNTGHIALTAGVAGGAEIILTPEHKLSMDEIEDLVEQCFARKKLFTMIVLAEGAGNARDIAAEISKRTGHEVSTTVLGYIQRGGTPTAFDNLLASRMGALAIDAFLHGESGMMTSFLDGKYQLKPIKDVLKKPKELNSELYELYKILAM